MKNIKKSIFAHKISQKCDIIRYWYQPVDKLIICYHIG